MPEKIWHCNVATPYHLLCLCDILVPKLPPSHYRSHHKHRPCHRCPSYSHHTPTIHTRAFMCGGCGKSRNVETTHLQGVKTVENNLYTRAPLLTQSNPYGVGEDEQRARAIAKQDVESRNWSSSFDLLTQCTHPPSLPRTHTSWTCTNKCGWSLDRKTLYHNNIVLHSNHLTTVYKERISNLELLKFWIPVIW